MDSETEDKGFRAIEFWWTAWTLGLIGFGAGLRCALLLDGARSLDRETGVWAGIALLATIWSAACAVMAAAKMAEARMRALIAKAGVHGSA